MQISLKLHLLLWLALRSGNSSPGFPSVTQESMTQQQRQLSFFEHTPVIVHKDE